MGCTSRRVGNSLSVLSQFQRRETTTLAECNQAQTLGSDHNDRVCGLYFISGLNCFKRYRGEREKCFI